ncbi:HNH endonuclease signature motif containing protein [Rossellomorea marisflavi]
MKVDNRRCRLCEVSKPLADFELDKRVKGGRTNRCKKCKLESKNKATHAFYKLCQRAKKSGEEVEVTLEEVKSLFEMFDGTCIYCGEKESEDGPTFHLEHVIARSSGGRNHISNLVISCPSCNSRKHNLPVVSYFFKDDRFKDDYFRLLAYYLSFASKQPVEEILWELTDQHATYETRRMLEGAV